MFYQEVNSHSLYYTQYGNKGPVVLMVHGNSETHEIFKKAARILAEKYTVILPDSPNHGRSVVLPKLTYHNMAMVYYNFIKELDIAPPIFYGFSDGGNIGLILASQFPELLSDLIISGANSKPEGLKRLSLIGMRLLNRLVHSDKLKLMLNGPQLSNGMLAKIKTQTLVIVGDRDAIRREHTENLVYRIPNSSLLYLYHENHSSYVVNDQKIGYILMDYLESRIKKH